MYLKVSTTHFYRLALCNLVLGLTNPSCSDDECHYGDMTDYGVLLGKIM